MTLYKSGTYDSSIIVSSSVYSCASCDYTEIASENKDEIKKCPKCGANMELISASASAGSQKIEDSKKTDDV